MHARSQLRFIVGLAVFALLVYALWPPPELNSFDECVPDSPEDLGVLVQRLTPDLQQTLSIGDDGTLLLNNRPPGPILWVPEIHDVADRHEIQEFTHDHLDDAIIAVNSLYGSTNVTPDHIFRVVIDNKVLADSPRARFSEYKSAEHGDAYIDTLITRDLRSFQASSDRSQQFVDNSRYIVSTKRSTLRCVNATDLASLTVVVCDDERLPRRPNNARLSLSVRGATDTGPFSFNLDGIETGGTPAVDKGYAAYRVLLPGFVLAWKTAFLSVRDFRGFRALTPVSKSGESVCCQAVYYLPKAAENQDMPRPTPPRINLPDAHDTLHIVIARSYTGSAEDGRQQPEVLAAFAIDPKKYPIRKGTYVLLTSGRGGRPSLVMGLVRP